MKDYLDKKDVVDEILIDILMADGELNGRDEICLVSLVAQYAVQNGIGYKSNEFRLLCRFAEWLEQKLKLCIFAEEEEKNG